ncbi:MAG TPA: tetratricopeptide repeat protein, partial [Sedimentisphaerales bacterium]|nr:tetratricopeptide repeat protein [Sedimentisphaerales bacterium]
MRRLLIAVSAALLIGGVCALLVKRQWVNQPLKEDIFTVDANTALPEDQPLDAAVKAIIAGASSVKEYGRIVVDYPFEGSVFPPEIVSPRFLWHDDAKGAGLWLVDVSFDTSPHHIYALTSGRLPERRIDLDAVSPANEYYKPSGYDLSARAWSPDEATWGLIKASSIKGPATVTILGLSGGDLKVLSRAAVRIRTSRDSVGAPIFYRDVPLMPSKTSKGEIKPLAQGALPLISWRLRDISKASAPVVLRDMPTCGSCHSFSRDGKVLAMDMDGPQGDKGAYAITEVKKDIVITSDDIISWSSYDGAVKGQKTLGLFSQVSPDARYVISTLNESVFVANYPDFRFLQSFYPTRGILVVYDRSTGQMNALRGANDADYVHANGCWSPDGEKIVFSKARAKDKYESEAMPTQVGDARETFIQYDLCVIPFNGGKGGAPKPLEGASNNGMSNSFARYSPDGKWIVFVQSEKGQLTRPDSKLYIIPAEGGKARLMNCNLAVMNSWHSFSPNGRWMVFSSKGFSPFTQMFLTHIDEDGSDSPPILIPNSTADNRAVNIPEFLNNSPDAIASISAPTHESYRHFKTAQELRDKGQYAEALAELEKSLRVNEFYAKAHNDKGCILFKTGDANEAALCFKKAIELDPDYGMPLGNLGSVLQSQGRLDEAAGYYKEALELDPSLVDAHFNYANILRVQGKLDEAIVHYRYAVVLQPAFAEGYCNLGIALLQKGMIADAMESLQKALDANPDYAAAHHNLGLAMARQGDMEGAATHLMRCVELAPENPFAHYDLARVFHAKKEYDSANKHYMETLRIRPDYLRARMGIADVLYRQGRLPQAVEEYCAVLRKQGEDTAALNALAWI